MTGAGFATGAVAAGTEIHKSVTLRQQRAKSHIPTGGKTCFNLTVSTTITPERFSAGLVVGKVFVVSVGVFVV